MNKKIVMAALVALAPLAAPAAELSYTYVEAGYSHADVSGLNLHGFALKGSADFGRGFYGAFGGHQDSYDSDNKLAPAEITLGYHKAIGGNTDFVGEASYVGVNSTVLGTDYHNDGYRVAAGVRSAVGDKVELGAKLTYTGVENMDQAVGVTLSGQFKFNATWGLVAEYRYKELNFLGDDGDSYQVGVRASF
ncbi:hypothetical protein [Lysobacter claricitrinus]|uniref:hypothetical protein n=1 Tax=Lysobacter claricitrinus TaxID=3367728 RepID=UPI0037DB553D